MISAGPCENGSDHMREQHSLRQAFTVSPFALTIYGTIGSFRQKLEICPHWLVPRQIWEPGYGPTNRSRRQIWEPELCPRWSVPKEDFRAGDMAPLISPASRFESRRYSPTYWSHRQIWEPEICPQWSVPQADLRVGHMSPLIGPTGRFECWRYGPTDRSRKQIWDPSLKNNLFAVIWLKVLRVGH